MIERRPPEVATGLVAIPRNRAELPAIIHDLHALGLPAGSVTAFGDADDAASRALASAGDSPPTMPDRVATRTAVLLEPGYRHEIFGAALGTALGLLGGLAALLVPGVGPLVFAGGAATVLAEEALAGLMGLSLGGVVGALTDVGLLAEHEALFKRAIAEGRWIVVVRGTPAEIDRAEGRLQAYTLDHLDRI